MKSNKKRPTAEIRFLEETKKNVLLYFMGNPEEGIETIKDRLKRLKIMKMPVNITAWIG